MRSEIQIRHAVTAAAAAVLALTAVMVTAAAVLLTAAAVNGVPDAARGSKKNGCLRPRPDF